MEERIKFLKEWLCMDKQYFKILTVVTVLADDKGEYEEKYRISVGIYQ